MKTINELATLQLQILINTNNFTPYQIAELLKAGADPRVRDFDGNSILHILIANCEVVSDYIPYGFITYFPTDINAQNTKGLTPFQVLISKSFENSFAMKLVRLGADPNLLNDTGKSLLHILVLNIGADKKFQIEELVNIHGANVDIKDSFGRTPLEYLISEFIFSTDDAMQLIRLGANPDVKNITGQTFKDIIITSTISQDNEKLLKELEELTLKYKQKQYHSFRNEFLNLLIRITNDRNNPESLSYLKKLPQDILLEVLSYLDFKAMGKTPQDVVALAREFLSKPQQVKDILKMPGGFNVFENQNPEATQKFTFFSSAKTFSLDYSRLKLKNMQAHRQDNLSDEDLQKRRLEDEKLEVYLTNHALSIWNQHSSTLNTNRINWPLYEEIKDLEPYNDKRLAGWE